MTEGNAENGLPYLLGKSLKKSQAGEFILFYQYAILDKLTRDKTFFLGG